MRILRGWVFTFRLFIIRDSMAWSLEDIRLDSWTGLDWTVLNCSELHYQKGEKKCFLFLRLGKEGGIIPFHFLFVFSSPLPSPLPFVLSFPLSFPLPVVIAIARPNIHTRRKRKKKNDYTHVCVRVGKSLHCFSFLLVINES